MLQLTALYCNTVQHTATHTHSAALHLTNWREIKSLSLEMAKRFVPLPRPSSPLLPQPPSCPPLPSPPSVLCPSPLPLTLQHTSQTTPLSPPSSYPQRHRCNSQQSLPHTTSHVLYVGTQSPTYSRWVRVRLSLIECARERQREKAKERTRAREKEGGRVKNRHPRSFSQSISRLFFSLKTLDKTSEHELFCYPLPRSHTHSPALVCARACVCSLCPPPPAASLRHKEKTFSCTLALANSRTLSPALFLSPFPSPSLSSPLPLSLLLSLSLFPSPFLTYPLSQPSLPLACPLPLSLAPSLSLLPSLSLSCLFPLSRTFSLSLAYPLPHSSLSLLLSPSLSFSLPLSPSLSLSLLLSPSLSCLSPLSRGGGLGSRPKKMYGERLGDGVDYH